MKNFWKILNAVCLSATIALPATLTQAQSSSATVSLTPYTFEIEPILGVLLPRDIWGTPSTMNTVGARASYVLSPPDGAIEISALYHYAGARDPEDSAIGFDASWRQEFQNDLLMAYFNIGMQYSKWSMDTDYDANNVCVLDNCGNDSGTHSGFRVGAGVIIPLGPTTPLKLGMTFMKGPQLLLLLESGIGIRF